MQNYVNPCYGFNSTIGQQISDLTRIRNSSSEPLTFSISSAYIRNPFITDESNPNYQVEFPGNALTQLIDPALSQSYVGNQSNIATLTENQGARISSGRSSDPNRRDDARQRFDLTDNIDCSEGGLNDSNTECNAFAPPILVTQDGVSEFDGAWYGSTEFFRYVGLNINAVPAEPELSVSKSVRPSTASPSAFTSNGPTSTSLTGAGNGTLEYMITLQNTGNVDLDNINLVDVLPPELAPVGTSSEIAGQISICSDLATAINVSAPCTIVRLASIALTDSNRIVLDSEDLGISATRPLARDPEFITTGTGSEGEVLRIRFFMTAQCVADDDDTAINYAIVSAESNTVAATITTRSGFTAHSGGLNVSSEQWTTYFPGHSLNTSDGSNPATNDTTVTLAPCSTPDEPRIKIGKYVRRVSPNEETSEPVFGTGAISTTITGTSDGSVEYAVLVENIGTGAINEIYFGDYLPTDQAFVPGSIRVEYCLNNQQAREGNVCTGGGSSVSDSAYNATTNILALNTINLADLNEGEVLRIRWRMSSVCTPVGTTPPTAQNYALIYATVGQDGVETFLFPDIMRTATTPYNISDSAYSVAVDLNPATVGGDITPFATNTTRVTLNNCDTPPPSVEKSVSTTARGNGTTPTTFMTNDSTATAVDFGQQAGAYTVHYRVEVTNESEEATLENVLLQDRFYYRNGSTVSAPNIVQPVGALLDTRVVNSDNTETYQPSVRRVIYTSRGSDNVVTFTIPSLLPGETLAFYYDIVIDPGTRSTTQYHRNEVQVCYDENGPNDDEDCNGDSDRVFNQDIPRTQNPLALTIIKTVNGQDANNDNTAVTVNNGATLTYVVTVTAPSTNSATVTGIVLSDNVTGLPNISNVRSISLTTPTGTCATPCALTSMSELAARSFDLAAGQTATLTYTATGINGTTTLSARNRNTATATPDEDNDRNPAPVNDPATVFVRPAPEDEEEPRTNFRINKEANPTITRHGDEVTYTITVEPRGSNDEIDDLTLLITDDINDDGTLQRGGVTFTYIRNSTRIRTDGADCEGEMDDEDGIRCENVSADEEIRITYRVRVSAPNLNPSDIVVVDNTARLRSDTPGVRIRDEDDAEVQVIASPSPDLPPPPEQLLRITKNVNQIEVRRGETVTYTIQVQNPNGQDVTRTLVDTIGLNGGTVPGQNGGRVRFVEGTLHIVGAQFSGSISNPTGMVLIIPAYGTATITYNATGEPERNQRVISLAPNTATLNTGEYATAFVRLPESGPAAIAVTAISSLIASGTYFISRRKKK